MLSTGLHFASESTPSSFLALRRRFWHCVGVRLRSRVFLDSPCAEGRSIVLPRLLKRPDALSWRAQCQGVWGRATTKCTGSAASA